MIRPVQSKGLYGILPTVFITLNAHTDNLKTIGVLELLTGILLVQSNQVGTFCPARTAPTPPEVEQYIMTAKLCQFKRLAIGQDSGKDRGFFPIDKLGFEVKIAKNKHVKEGT